MKAVTGMAWYHASDYDRLKNMFTDGDLLPDDFESWIKIARRARQLIASGIVVEKFMSIPILSLSGARRKD